MHAACIWGQRFAGIVPFPVGFDERRVLLPTRPGERYWAHVLPVAVEGGVLSFELRLYDGAGRLCELCLGLRMRDVSAGRMRPPEAPAGRGGSATRGGGDSDMYDLDREVGTCRPCAPSARPGSRLTTLESRPARSRSAARSARTS